MATAAHGVDVRHLNESVVTHTQPRRGMALSSVSEMSVYRRFADSGPGPMPKSAFLSGDSVWRDQIALSMLIDLNPTLEPCYGIDRQSG